MENLAHKVVNTMLANDKFSAWLGIELIELKSGYCVLKMKVRNEMLNGFDILHGGITFSLADSALAFAANSHGKKSVSIEASMSYVESCKEGDELTAIASEISVTNKIGIYNIEVSNQEGTKVALFKGTVYRTGKDWV